MSLYLDIRIDNSSLSTTEPSVHLIHCLCLPVGILLSLPNGFLRILLAHIEPPAKLVLDLAELNVLERRQQLKCGLSGVFIALGDVSDGLLAWLGAGSEALVLGPGLMEGLRGRRVDAAGDGADGDEGGGGACGEDLGEVGQLTVVDLDGRLARAMQTKRFPGGVEKEEARKRSKREIAVKGSKGK